MNLQEFIQESLIQIARATVEANKTFKTDGLKASVNVDGLNHSHKIDFDVAVTAETTGGSSGHAGLKVLSFGLGGETSSEASHSMASRIHFSIPIRLPIPSQCE